MFSSGIENDSFLVIGLGRHRQPSACLSIETRPTLLEGHCCALRLVQGSVDLRKA